MLRDCCGGGYYGGGSSANAGKQIFSATASQVDFVVTEFTLNVYNVFVDGDLQSWGYSNTGNTITFTTPFSGGEEVIIIGIK